MIKQFTALKTPVFTSPTTQLATYQQHKSETKAQCLPFSSSFLSNLALNYGVRTPIVHTVYVAKSLSRLIFVASKSGSAFFYASFRFRPRHELLPRLELSPQVIFDLRPKNTCFSVSIAPHQGDLKSSVKPKHRLTSYGLK